MEESQYRIQRKWSNFFARYEYVLQERSKYGTSWDDTEYDGDEDWAKRQVVHHNCKIVDENEKELWNE